jgi:hypothetical protein
MKGMIALCMALGALIAVRPKVGLLLSPYSSAMAGVHRSAFKTLPAAQGHGWAAPKPTAREIGFENGGSGGRGEAF